MTKYMTIPIHGTYSSSDRWYKPQSDLWNHLKTEFAQDYFEDDPTKIFNWIPALGTNRSRQRGGRRLFDYCDRYHRSLDITHFRLIGHSHGASVANICSHEMETQELDFESQDTALIKEWNATVFSWKIQSIVMLAPFVAPYLPPDHRPNMPSSYVACDNFFNFHPAKDQVVPDRFQDYDRFPNLKRLETRVEFANGTNHWDPTKLKFWTQYDLVDVIKNGNG